MTVEDVRAIAPEAEVYELNPHARYIVVLRKGSASIEIAKAIGEAMTRMLGAAPTIILTYDPAADIRLLEVKP